MLGSCLNELLSNAAGQWIPGVVEGEQIDESPALAAIYGKPELAGTSARVTPEFPVDEELSKPWAVGK